MKKSFSRILGVLLRNYYSLKHNLDRLVDLFYWPILELIIMGLTFAYITKSLPNSFFQISMIMSAIILWFVLWRGQYEITMGLLEDLWSDSFVNLLGTPLRLTEWIAAFMLTGVVKLVVPFLIMAPIAKIMFGVDFFALGLALIPMVINLLIMGWTIGLLISGSLLRFGTNLQSLAWAGAYLLFPLSAAYYPLSALSPIVQKISLALPSTYIFEEVRSLIFNGTFVPMLIIKSFILNVIYFALIFWFFTRSFKQAKKNGIAHLK